MNNCSVDLQRRIITAMEEAVFTLPGQPTIADVEEYIGLKISKKFTFKSVRDNIPIRIAFKESFWRCRPIRFGWVCTSLF